jgi:hypothetical protein
MVTGMQQPAGTRGGHHQGDPDEQGDEPDSLYRALRRSRVHRLTLPGASSGQQVSGPSASYRRPVLAEPGRRHGRSG